MQIKSKKGHHRRSGSDGAALKKVNLLNNQGIYSNSQAGSNCPSERNVDHTNSRMEVQNRFIQGNHHQIIGPHFDVSSSQGKSTGKKRKFYSLRVSEEIGVKTPSEFNVKDFFVKIRKDMGNVQGEIPSTVIQSSSLGGSSANKTMISSGS